MNPESCGEIIEGKIRVIKNRNTGKWLWYCRKSNCHKDIVDEPDHIYWVDRESQQTALKGGLRHLQEAHHGN